MAEANAAAEFEVTAVLGQDRQVVAVPLGATVQDVWSQLNCDAQQVIPTIGGHAASWRTHLVPNAVVHFV